MVVSWGEIQNYLVEFVLAAILYFLNFQLRKLYIFASVKLSQRVAGPFYDQTIVLGDLVYFKYLAVRRGNDAFLIFIENARFDFSCEKLRKGSILCQRLFYLFKIDAVLERISIEDWPPKNFGNPQISNISNHLA